MAIKKNYKSKYLSIVLPSESSYQSLRRKAPWSGLDDSLTRVGGTLKNSALFNYKELF